MKIRPNTFIKPSKIHGLGLFAMRDIKRGDRIIQGYADYSFQDEWTEYIKKWKESSFGFNNGYCMINHQDEPNTRRGKKLEVIATKDIKKNDEVTENYYALSSNENPFLNYLEEALYRALRQRMNKK